jgi:diguanylate cyclase (GGDEF)-like protein/PAS domain S-box-containing protein
MGMQPLPTIVYRRSDRVSMTFPIEASGIDYAGNPFRERTRTATVSRFGCCLPIPHFLRPEQEIHLRRLGTSERAEGHVVSRMGAHSDGFLYGVGMPESCESLWGIRFSSSFHHELADSVYDGVYFVSRDQKITYWSEGAERLAGYSAGEAVGQQCFNDFLGHVDESGQPLNSSGGLLSSVLSDGQPREADVYLRHKNGHRVPIGVRALPMRGADGAIVGAVEVFSARPLKKVPEKRVSDLENMAFRDSLTSLPNRRYLEVKVAQALEDHQQFGRQYGLLIFDLDSFKQVNDKYGHETGDEVLKIVAETLVQRQRTIDLVGRWGGEEFLVLMPDVNAVDLGDLAERCRILISQASVAHGAVRVSVTASIGATLLDHLDSEATVIGRADGLMYQSKHSGGDRTTTG